jgi:aspartate racemase
MSTRKLGIIGGIGASAGVNLVARLVLHYQKAGAVKDSDFPEFVYYNLPAYGMDALGICNQDQVFGQLESAMHLLSDAKCNVVFIACNTVHVFHERLQALFPAITIVNNIAESCHWAQDCSKVGVLASRNSKTLGLFGKALAHLNIECVETDEIEQQALDKSIERVIAGKEGGVDFQLLFNIAHLMTGRGAEKFILGCTELPMLMDCDHKDFIDAGWCGMLKAIELIKAT